MSCHYEVMGVERTATADEIKKAYKKQALKWHPDRNFGKEAEAEERFKEVTSAYNVLSDSHERKWYDDHRESILRGTDGTRDAGKKRSDFEDNLDLWQFFNTSCYDGFGDDGESFYSVYSHVFENLLAYENNEEQQQTEPNGKKHGLVDYPPFGDRMSSSSDTINFYNNWSNFVTILSFSWEDEYNPSEAENRQVRREIEKHNKKARDTGRRKYTDLVKALVAFVRKRDPRIQVIETAAAQKKKQEAEHRRQIRQDELDRREAYRVALANGEIEEDPEEKARREQEYSTAYLLADESSDEDGDGTNEWDEVGGRVKRGRRSRKKGIMKSTGGSERGEEEEEEGPELVAKAGGGSTANQEEEEEEEEEFSCELCKKSFDSYAQLAQHLTSKAHRRAEKDKEKEEKSRGGGKGPRKEKKSFVKRGKSDD